MSNELVVVLLPGLDGTGKLFDRLLLSCPRQFEPQVVVYPGDKMLDYHELEVLVRERLPQRRPFIIVAESFSGPLAIALASRGIDNLVGVVLAASFVTPPRSALWQKRRGSKRGRCGPCQTRCTTANRPCSIPKITSSQCPHDAIAVAADPHRM